MKINIDFDGTVVSHDFPRIGKDIGAVPILKRLVEKGHQLILFTMRSDRPTTKDTKDETIQDVSGMFLTEAVQWFKDNGIELYAIQKDPNQVNWTDSPKSYAELMIDDSALGCPLKYNPEISEKMYVDWNEVEKILRHRRII